MSWLLHDSLRLLPYRLFVYKTRYLWCVKSSFLTLSRPIRKRVQAFYNCNVSNGCPVSEFNIFEINMADSYGEY